MRIFPKRDRYYIKVKAGYTRPTIRLRKRVFYIFYKEYAYFSMDYADDVPKRVKAMQDLKEQLEDLPY